MNQTLAEQEPDLVLRSLCLGDHVDHHVVRDALTPLADPDRLLLWEDWPYADRVAAVATEPALAVELTDATLAARLAACGCYALQLGFQFGGHEALARRTAAITQERFHQP